MTQVPREWLGSIELTDMTALFALQGQENPPYPFMPAAPDAASVASVARRVSDGDLNVFRKWVITYQDADIWLECRVLHNRDDLPDIRILAYRAAYLGFFAVQRPYQDVVDVYQLSPYDLGPAVANSVGCTRPGSRGRIVIPKYENYFRETSPDDEPGHEMLVLHPVASETSGTAARVANSDVAALATIQSHFRPARSWGADWDSAVLVWVQIRDDGDYIYDPDFNYAEPATERALSERIDQLIAHDVAALRQLRGSR